MPITKEQADKAYREGNPLISDVEYDELFGINASDIDTPSLENRPKVKLSMPMGSLLKENTLPDLISWKQKYGGTKGICWSDKLDGSSGQLTYQDGRLISAVTRGNGLIGDDVTNWATKMRVPQQIDYQQTLYVRVEFILLVEDWKKHFSDKKNPRNAATGALTRLDHKGCEYVHCIPFDIHGESIAVTTKKEKFEFLKSLGFTMPNYGVVETDEEIDQLIKKISEERENLPYQIDGLVFESNDLKHYQELGERSQRPRAARAFKFEAKSAVTTIKSVTWQVGKVGFITPVGELEPVDIDGVTIGRVMLNNPSELATLKLGPNSKVELIRSNDVIPKIRKGLDFHNSPFEIPHSCPACGTATILQDDKVEIDIKQENLYSKISSKKARLKCPNHETCPAQGHYRIVYYLKTLGARGFGDETIAKLLDAGLIKDQADLYTVHTVKFAELEGMSHKVVDKLLKELHQKSKEVPLPRFISSLAIPGVSESTAKMAMEVCPDLESMKKVAKEQLLSISGFGEYKADCFVWGMNNKAELIEKLSKWVQIDTISGDGPFKDKTFCFTGVRDKQAEEQIKKLGGTVKSSAVKDLTYLIAGDPTGRSTKLDKARSNGTTIIGIEELKNMLAKG